ncbi:aromatic ring-hydroxylating oxygenase subunit alpha [Rhizorhabdus wittichii]|jgi:p-cumate 2,3-dioxygenase alpha subunit|uniref:Ring hydroxylating dioxygenase, alpha subunit n=2 Tax=Rhizorhabdus wittichii TaxID=160791 RepID=A0A9J9LDP9_RHIWR|nr:aromatic ring-hydroxylating dioxygenase subunit alpha [Rhizorhabdus wittichii]ABQ68120.1 ring hydroxylating dioxygenase, alpha subunit [Rhizorhabdus wittichii RW1]ARR54979.1 p-cumate dioxygenase [Rhizorhabdus wittichii DC-6]QTH21448.1 Rieske 2Fe-2S domain-containing protein [Rhizorhabdus wittichii]
MATAFEKHPTGTAWVVEDRDSFRVARTTFTDQDVLERERAAIFDRCWLYIGHESELPNPNDFVRRAVGGRDLVFNRDRKGDYHAFFNSCPHRGAAVVREDKGSAISFKCFYHGWSFNNNGAFATRFAAGTYPEDFNKDGCANLVAVPRLAGYAGFWFVNFDANAESLEDYLAGAKDFLQVVADHGADGMEIVGGIQEYSVRANWKLLVENSFDGYHAHETHSTYLEYLVDAIGGPAELFPSRGNISRAYDLGNGHAVIEGPAPWGRPVAQWIPAWGEDGREEIAAIYAELEKRLGKERAEQVAYGNRNLLIFPNLVINDIMAITVRTFYPEQPDYMNVNSWALAPKGEARHFRKRRLDNFLEFLGPGGFATPDDVEALESCQRSYRNRAAAGWNDISRGMLRDEPLADDEAQMRAFWREWDRRVAKAG